MLVRRTAPVRVRLGLVAVSAAALLAVLAPAGQPKARAATTPAPLAGVWAWEDRDELLLDARNPRTVRFIVRGKRVLARFGRQRPVPVAFAPRPGTVRLTAPRWVDGQRIAVRYEGRLGQAGGRPSIDGFMRFRVGGRPERSAFQAVRIQV